MSAAFARIFSSRLFWPIVMLLVLFLVNVIAFPGSSRSPSATATSTAASSTSSATVRRRSSSRSA